VKILSDNMYILKKIMINLLILKVYNIYNYLLCKNYEK
jgi:hypothetical protein